MSVLTCSFTVRSVCFRTSSANVSVHFSLEMHLEHSYHCVVFLSVHSSNSTLVLFCLVTLSKPSFSSITTAQPGSSLFAPTRARAKTTATLKQKKGGDAALVAQLSIDEGDEDELFYDEKQPMSSGRKSLCSQEKTFSSTVKPPWMSLATRTCFTMSASRKGPLRWRESNRA